MRLKVGELSKQTGLTVRALHHYDKLGLLSPSVRSEAGYRLYGPKDIQRLNHILALRQLDIPLEEIRQMLDGGALRKASALDSQLALIDAEIIRWRKLRREVMQLRHALAEDEEPSFEACLRTLEAMAFYRRHLNHDEHALPLLGSGGKLAATWQVRLDAVRILFEKAVPARANEARTAARNWIAQLEKDTRSHAAKFVRLDRLFSDQVNDVPPTGFTPALGQYILEAFCEYRLAIYRSHLAPGAFRHLRKNYLAVMREWPVLLERLEAQRAAGRPPGHPDVQELARTWLGMRRALAIDDAALQAMRYAEDIEQELRIGTWLHPRLLSYLRRAVAGISNQAIDRE